MPLKSISNLHSRIEWNLPCIHRIHGKIEIPNIRQEPIISYLSQETDKGIKEKQTLSAVYPGSCHSVFEYEYSQIEASDVHSG
jgi:hypothetical protein